VAKHAFAQGHASAEYLCTALVSLTSQRDMFSDLAKSESTFHFVLPAMGEFGLIGSFSTLLVLAFVDKGSLYIKQFHRRTFCLFSVFTGQGTAQISFERALSYGLFACS